MCGIAGIVALAGHRVDIAVLKRMTDTIVHRGPDGEGHWQNASGSVGLGHRRLSILDLSEAGHQPMHYAGDRFTITFNGEIYNFVELQQELESRGYRFHSHCDTEVLMAAYHRWGPDCLQQFDGMFAFAIWDAQEGSLFCARDRFGEKPFYYAASSEGIHFASEMKALWAAGVSRTPHPSSVYNYLSYGQLQNPADLGQTFFADIRRLPAASYMLIRPESGIVAQRKYWDISLQTVEPAGGEKAAVQVFQDLFYTSLRRRLRSDVPLGSSLSGGLDSSVIVGAMDGLDIAQQIQRKTFSAQFPGFQKDESRYQKIVTGHTHVRPCYIVPTEESLLHNWDTLIYHQEEPFSSASINVQYEVYGLAKREGITVMLDGQGADEILAGYHSYFNSYFKELRRTGKQQYAAAYREYIALQAGNSINTLMTPSKWRHLKAMLPKAIAEGIAHRRQQLSAAKKALNPEYYNAYKQYDYRLAPSFDTLNEDLYFSTCKIGLSELLRYADRNSMAHSVEVRLPFLQHELVQYLFSLPATYKIRNGYTKWILRKAFTGLLPDEIIWRRDKIGFEPPQNNWLQSATMLPRIHHADERLRAAGIIPAGGLLTDVASIWRRLMAGQLLG